VRRQSGDAADQESRSAGRRARLTSRGSGKSPLVFATIAAESQRLINETYSAFLQGFMPTLARPEVDVLEGVTTAIIVDQGRIGSDPRSTVGTATDANALLRILFSRLGKPHIGPPAAFAFNVPSVRASGAITVEKGDGKTVAKSFSRAGGMCPRCDGRGAVSDLDLAQLFDDSKSLNEGALTIPGYKSGGWNYRLYTESGLVDPDKPLRRYTKVEAKAFLHQEPTRMKIAGINMTYEGLIPRIERSMLSKDSESMRPTSGRSSSAPSPSPTARSAAARGSPMRRVPPGSARSTSPTPVRCRSPTSPSGCAGSTSRAWHRCSRRSGARSTPSSRSASVISRWSAPRARSPASRRSG
jgi:hypothetical protein